MDGKSVLALVALLMGSLPAAAEPATRSLVVLPLPSFRPAVVVAPLCAGPRPVVVALHGNFDRPEWNCEALQQLVEGRAWLLCLRGIPRRDTPRELDRWTYAGRARVKAELEEALATLRARYPQRVAPGTPVLAGFSLGAILAARFAVAEPARFPLLYLVEGSHQVWSAASRQRFAKQGGRALLFGCGRRGCGAQARALCRTLQPLGLLCAEVTVPSLGHAYTDPLPARALPLFREMVAQDSRWQCR